MNGGRFPFVGRALARCVHPRWRADIVADLYEEHSDRLDRGVGARSSHARLAMALIGAALASHAQAIRYRPARFEGSGGGGGMETVWQDVRYSLRGLRRAPLFTLVALLTLGAGMGLTVAMFAVVNAVLLRPLDYPEPESLVLVQGQPGALRGVSMPQHIQFRDASAGLAAAAAWQGWSPVLSNDNGELQRLPGASVSHEFFMLLRTQPAAGRLFSVIDGDPGHEPVVVLDHTLWATRFGADPQVVGQLVEFDREPYRIVGVAPEGFLDPVARGLGRANPSLWRATPPAFIEAETDAGWVGFWSIGRLRPGATPGDVTAEMRRSLVEGYEGVPDVARYASEFRAIRVRDAVVEDVRPTLRILFLAVGLVLLISCVNIANLLLSRAAVRRQEMAIRSSVGAHRRRLVRQLFTESLVLALGGATLGAALAAGGLRLFVAMGGEALPRSGEIAIDGSVLLFSLLASAATAVFFGVVPALRATDELLDTRSRGASSRSTGGLRRGLVVLETALAMVLLTGAGLLATAALRIEAVDPGFAVEGRAIMTVDLGAERFPTPEDQAAALVRIREALHSLPAVSGVGAITDLPLSGAVNSTRIRRAGDSDDEAAARSNVLVRAITPGYLEAMAMPRLQGVDFDATARLGAEDVAIVNDEFARRFYEGADPLGEVVWVRGIDRRIVAVVPSVREFDLTGATRDPVLYTPYAQEREGWMRSRVTLVLALSTRSAADLQALRSVALEAEPRALVGRAAPFSSAVNELKRGPRLRAGLIVAFAALALLLAAVGMGGVVAYSVSQRIREIGIRLALGARRGDVQAMVLKDTARMTMVGVGLGLVGALLAGRGLADFLFEVNARDPWVLSAAGIALLVVGLVSGWLPARRASRLDPATTLRSE